MGLKVPYTRSADVVVGPCDTSNFQSVQDTTSHEFTITMDRSVCPPNKRAEGKDTFAFEIGKTISQDLTLFYSKHSVAVYCYHLGEYSATYRYDAYTFAIEAYESDYSSVDTTPPTMAGDPIYL